MTRAALASLLLLMSTGCAALLEKPAVDPGDDRLESSLLRLNVPVICERPGVYVEVDWISGCEEPSREALDELEAAIREYCKVPAGVVVRVDAPLEVPEWSGTRGQWSWAAGKSLGPSPMVYRAFARLHVLYVPRMDYRATYGFFRPHEGIPTITVFQEAVQEASTLMITPEKVEATLLVHELGHWLGVPARGSHDDGIRHCTRPDCVMYKPIDWRATLANWWRVLFLWAIPDRYCVLCEEELAALRK